MSCVHCDKIRRVRDGGLVVRYHTTPTLRSQNVADHSYGVAQLVRVVSEGQCSSACVFAALDHDLGELDTGDMPAQVKWANPRLAQELRSVESAVEARWDWNHDLSPEEHKLLKICDMLELVLYCHEERRLGNRAVDVIFHHGTTYLLSKFDLENEYPIALSILNRAQETYGE